MSTLRIAGMIAVIAGAIISLSLCLLAGKSTPLLLLVMFVGWVLLPFAAMAAGLLTSRLSSRDHAILSAASIFITIASISVYAYFTYLPLTTTPARTWLLVPGFSLILIAAAFIYLRLRRQR